MWLDLGYSHFLTILPFVQHIRIRLDLVALRLVIAHFLSSRRVWTQFLMLPFLKIFGKIFAIVASGEEWSISWLRIVTIHWTYDCFSQEFSIFWKNRWVSKSCSIEFFQWRFQNLFVSNSSMWTFVFSSFSIFWSLSKFPCSIDLRFELVDKISREKFRLLLFLMI